MRDLFITLLLPILLYALFKKPFVAVGLWVWTAMFFPNYWVFGFATSIRFNLLISVCTVMAYMIYDRKLIPSIRFQSTGWMVILLLFWAFLSTTMAENSFEVSYVYWVRFLKAVILFVFVFLTIREKLHFEFFLWCLVLSIGAYGGLEGVKYIASGGGHKIVGMGAHALGDRNELAVSMVMMIPVCAYFANSASVRENKLVRAGFLFLIVLLVLAVIGTNSRGGLISLIFLTCFFILQSKNKISYSLLAGSIAIAALQLAPDSWFDRMETIESADEDASFMGRVVAWKLSTILAMENPFLGGGIKALEYNPVWADLSSKFYNGYASWFPTGNAVPEENGRAAHSIYFQILGDLGFVGLAIFISILLGSLKRATRIVKNSTEEWVRDMARMLKISMIAYMIGGAALSFAYFEVLYTFVALLIILESRIEKKILK